MSKTVYDAKAMEAWRLVHEAGQPIKLVSRALKVPVSEIYEMLAQQKSQGDVRDMRRAALGGLNQHKFTPPQAR